MSFKQERDWQPDYQAVETDAQAARLLPPYALATSSYQTLRRQGYSPRDALETTLELWHELWHPTQQPSNG